MGQELGAAGAINLTRPSGSGQDAADDSLGRAMLEILRRRCSQRVFAAMPPGRELLSRLLWAAAGFNRASHLTAPSAYNNQETSVYVALPDGLYRYDAGQNMLLNHGPGADPAHHAGTKHRLAAASGRLSSQPTREAIWEG